jgi:protein-disulfide isomerase
MSEKKPGFFDAPPQTMFFFGIVVGVAAVLLLQTLMGGASFGARGGGNNVPRQVVTSPTPTPSVPQGELAPVTDQDWVQGDLKKAKVVLVEYSDLECSFCQRFHPTLKAVTERYGDQVAWVYRHFPLTSIHPNAEPAANAAECVGEQLGSRGFFAFIDQIFEGGQPLNNSTYTSIARSLRGMNMNKFEECVTSNKYIGNVRQQQADGVAAGVQGTPATFVNGQLVSGAVPEAQLTAIIEQLLAQ